MQIASAYSPPSILSWHLTEDREGSVQEEAEMDDKEYPEGTWDSTSLDNTVLFLDLFPRITNDPFSLSSYAWAICHLVWEPQTNILQKMTPRKLVV